MAYWLVKSEPETWSWHDQTTQKVTHWDGVRNYQAANNLKAMNVNDLCFFYHSCSERQIVGIVKVIKTAHPDPSDPTGRFVMVDVEWHKNLKNPVPLSIVKAHPALSHLALVKQSRLSVMPIDQASWELINELSENPL